MTILLSGSVGLEKDAPMCCLAWTNIPVEARHMKHKNTVWNPSIRIPEFGRDGRYLGLAPFALTLPQIPSHSLIILITTTSGFTCLLGTGAVSIANMRDG